MLVGVPEKNARFGPCLEFVNRVMRNERVAKASEHSKMFIGWRAVIEELGRCKIVSCFGWEDIY